MSFNTNSPNSQAILPPEFAALVQEPLAAASLAYHPAISTTVQVAAHELRIPVLKADPVAEWVAEGEKITETAPALDEVNVYFAKVAGLTTITQEMANDSNPAAMDITGNGLARDLARKIDAAFFGNLPAPAPAGLGSITPSTVTGALDSLDVFADALAESGSNGAQVSAFVVNPADALSIRKLKSADGALSPLLGPDASAAGATTIFGVPVIESVDVDQGTGWALDKNYVYTAQRQGITLAISDQYYFDSDRIAIRATARVGFAMPQPHRLTQITFSAGV